MKRREKVAINPEWQQNGFTAIPNFILEAAPGVSSIPTVNALAYLQFIANRYDSSHRKHTIPTSDADFADYSGFSPKTAQKIRLALLKAGLILSERAKQACWFITFCDRAAALNISPERHNIPTERHLENDENVENPHQDCDSGVGTDSAQVDLNKELKPLSPGETQGVKANKAKPLSRKVLLQEFKVYRSNIGKPMKGRRADVHFYKVVRSLINELCKRRGATPNDGLKALAYLIRNRLPHVHEEAGMASPVYSLGYFEQTDNGKRILLECHEACERERAEAAAAVEYTQELIDDCFLATLYLRLQRTGNEPLSDTELAELYRDTVASMTSPQ